MTDGKRCMRRWMAEGKMERGKEGIREVGSEGWKEGWMDSEAN